MFISWVFMVKSVTLKFNAIHYDLSVTSSSRLRRLILTISELYSFHHQLNLPVFLSPADSSPLQKSLIILSEVQFTAAVTTFVTCRFKQTL